MFTTNLTKQREMAKEVHQRSKLSPEGGSWEYTRRFGSREYTKVMGRTQTKALWITIAIFNKYFYIILSVR